MQYLVDIKVATSLGNIFLDTKVTGTRSCNITLDKATFRKTSLANFTERLATRTGVSSLSECYVWLGNPDGSWAIQDKAKQLSALDWDPGYKPSKKILLALTVENQTPTVAATTASLTSSSASSPTTEDAAARLKRISMTVQATQQAQNALGALNRSETNSSPSSPLASPTVSASAAPLSQAVRFRDRGRTAPETIQPETIQPQTQSQTQPQTQPQEQEPGYFRAAPTLARTIHNIALTERPLAMSEPSIRRSNSIERPLAACPSCGIKDTGNFCKACGSPIPRGEATGASSNLTSSSTTTNSARPAPHSAQLPRTSSVSVNPWKQREIQTKMAVLVGLQSQVLDGSKHKGPSAEERERKQLKGADELVRSQTSPDPSKWRHLAKSHKVKKEQQMAKDFEGISSAQPETRIWKLVDNNLVVVPLSDFGRLCFNHCYLHLFWRQNLDKSFQAHIYYWIGENAGEEMATTIMEKAFSLDDFLQGTAVVHKETQLHESHRFMALFKNHGVEYIDSTGTKIDAHNLQTFNTQLLHLKGRRSVRVTPVPVSYKSMNSGDVFILDSGGFIYLWIGSGACRAEAKCGVQTAIRLRDSRQEALAMRVDEGKEPIEFWEALGGKGPVAHAVLGSDDAFERESEKIVKLYSVTETPTGAPQVTYIATTPLKQQFLDPAHCHILDIGTELFVWLGSQCTEREKISAMYHAGQFLKNEGRPDWIPIERLTQGTETALFKAQFVVWEGVEQQANIIERAKSFKKKSELMIDNVVSGIGSVVRVDTGYEGDAELFSTDGTGRIQIWQIQNFSKKLVPEIEHGIFYSGDSYVILWTPDENQGIFPICYYWLGRYSTQDERGTAALLVKKVAGDAKHCRVIQGKEPPHFLNLFHGKMVVRTGGYASGFEALGQVDQLADGSPELFHIKGTTERNTHAVQVETKAIALCSADCFVLNWEKERKQFVWHGKGSEPIEREYATTAASFLRDCSSIVSSNSSWSVSNFEEEAETDEFWQILGGKTPYLNPAELKSNVQEARLFHCSDISGTFQIEEVVNFSQEDLMSDDAYILDARSTVFVWVGPHATEREREGALSTALEYIKTASKYDGRSEDTPVVCTVTGNEPPMFTYWFHPWEPNLHGTDSYDIELEKLGREGRATMLLKKLGINSESGTRDATDILNDMKTHKEKSWIYPYSLLRRDRNRHPPEGVAHHRMEFHLDDTEFFSLFKMSKVEWEHVPKWRQDKVKASLHLW